MKQRTALISVMAVFTLLINTRVWADDKAPVPAAAPESAAPAAETPEGGVEVVRMILCSAVKDREPDQEVTAAKVGDTVTGWTQIRSGLGEITVTHRWLHEEENMGDVPLAVKASPWRTWSRKTVSAPGNWKVQVLDSAGAVLKELAFTVNPT